MVTSARLSGSDSGSESTRASSSASQGPCSTVASAAREGATAGGLFTSVKLSSAEQVEVRLPFAPDEAASVTLKSTRRGAALLLSDGEEKETARMS